MHWHFQPFRNNAEKKLLQIVTKFSKSFREKIQHFFKNGHFLGATCEGNSSVYYNSSKPVLTATGPGLVFSSIHPHEPTIKLTIADDSFSSSLALYTYFDVHVPDTVPPNRKCVDIFSLSTALILTF